MDEALRIRKTGSRTTHGRSTGNAGDLFHALSELAHLQLQSASVSDRVAMALSVLGRMLKAGRIALFEFHATDATVLLLPAGEWQSDRTRSSRNGATLANLPLEDAGLARWREDCDAGALLIGSTTSIPEPERQFFHLRQCAYAALCCVPVAGRAWGFLSVEYFHDGVPFDDLSRDFLRSASALLGGILGVDAQERHAERVHDELYEITAMRSSMADELVELKEWKGQLFSSFAHQFQTPLYTLLGFSATLLENEELEQDQEIRRTCLEHIYEQSVRLEKLVSEMMYASRLQARNYPLRMQEIDLTALVHDLDPMLRATTDRGSVELFIETPAEPITLAGDQALLRQMVVNLVESSLATTPAGGWVSIALSGDEGNVILTVSDNGTGIPAERLDRVFEPFLHYASLPSSAAGAGLGLSIARDIVDLHHGFITADSKVGEGTTMTVVLPRSHP
jgi:signal transduction histidine kinase